MKRSKQNFRIKIETNMAILDFPCEIVKIFRKTKNEISGGKEKWVEGLKVMTEA